MRKKRIIGLAIASTAALLLAGCSSAAGTTPNSTENAAPTEMNMCNFAGNLGDTIAEIAQGFEKKYNVHINWCGGSGSGTENVAHIAAKAGAQIYDDTLVDVQNQNLASVKGLWAKLDPKIVDVGDVYKIVLAPNADSVPIGVITTDLYYNTDVFKKNGWASPTSFQDLLDPKYCGKVGILDSSQSYGIYTVLGLGGLGAADAKAGNIQDAWDQGLKKLQSIKSCLPTIESSGGALEQKMQTGQYAIGAHGSVRILPLIKAGAPLAAVVPSEGAFLTTSYIAPVKDAPHPKLAQQFAAWFLTADAQQKLMEETFYGPILSTVKVPSDLVKLGVPDKTVIDKLILPDTTTVTNKRSDWTDAYQRTMG